MFINNQKFLDFAINDNNVVIARQILDLTEDFEKEEVKNEINKEILAFLKEYIVYCKDWLLKEYGINHYLDKDQSDRLKCLAQDTLKEIDRNHFIYEHSSLKAIISMTSIRYCLDNNTTLEKIKDFTKLWEIQNTEFLKLKLLWTSLFNKNAN